MNANRRVLVVDDEEDTRVTVSRLLEKMGFQVETVGSGEDAVTAFQAGKPDLMVLDLGLPGIDGWTVIEKLMPIGPPPVILLASRSDDPKSGPFQECIVGYLYKPLHYGELAASCKRLLSAPEAGAEAVDRRQFRRRRLIVDVTLMSKDGAPAVVGKLVDLSARGLQMEMSVPLDVGEGVRIILHVPGPNAQLTLYGRVLWKKDAENGFAYGLDLGELNRDDARRLNAFLEP